MQKIGKEPVACTSMAKRYKKDNNKDVLDLSDSKSE